MIKCRKEAAMWYVAIALMVVVQSRAGPSPLRLTIDCSSEEESYRRQNFRSKSRFDSNQRVNSFCDLIHNAIPNAVQGSRFVLIPQHEDQTGYSDSLAPISVSPPKGFIPNFQKHKILKPKVHTFNVPKLRAESNVPFRAPSVGPPRSIILFNSEDESSAERMEKFKKGVQKMLHAVKALGQIGQYLSERTRIVTEKLTKTFADWTD